MKIQWKKLILCLAVPLAVGGLSALITGNSMQMFETLRKPPLSPPGWLFPVVWTILYILMGIASYLVLTSAKPNRSRSALLVYGVQLFFNFFWPILFFSLKLYLSAFFWLVLLWLLICFIKLQSRQASCSFRICCGSPLQAISTLEFIF